MIQSNAIEDSYPLTPLQQGMLFNTLRSPGSGVDIEQLHFEFHEALDVMAFKRAWGIVIARHAVLRTSLRWENPDEPLQVVHSKVDLPWEDHDWRTIAPDQRARQLADFLIADRHRGFDLSYAPLFRLRLLHIEQAEYHFIWTFHHSVLEGRSYLFVLQEVFAGYEALCGGTQVSLPERRPYRDYISWLQQQDFHTDEAYWRETLKGFNAPTPLVIDHPPDETCRGDDTAHGTEECTLSVPVTSKLHSLAKEHQLTLNTIAQGVWALLLSRYSGETDVVYGVIRGTRRGTVDGADAMVGLILNTLPLRVRIDPHMPILPWLHQVQQQWRSMHGHEHTPLALIQSWSEVQGGMPLFHSTLMFETYHLDTMLRDQGGAWVNRRVNLLLQTNYPIGLSVFDGSELRLKINFDRCRINADSAVRMLGHLRTLIESMAFNPQQTVAKLPLLDGTERQQLLLDWNSTAVSFPPARCVQELFERQARLTPHALAVAYGNQQLTYDVLNIRANQLAHYLITLGAGPNVPVGICIGRSPEYIVGILAILKSGSAYIPLDPGYPQARLTYMLEDTHAPVLITLREHHEQTAQFSGRVVCLDQDWKHIATEPGATPLLPASANNLVYVIYTSGSTGLPKGVPITHQSLCNLIYWHQQTYAVTVSTRATLIAEVAFDASAWEIWPYLTAGASIHILQNATRQNPPLLVSWLNQQRITHTFLPTLLAEAVLHEHWPLESSLRWLLTGGDKLSRPPVRKLPFRLVNHYGPTENTVVSTYATVPDQSDSHLSPPIGRPLPNTRAYVLDAYMQPVPIGVAGELLLGGGQLSPGYWNRPELTEEKFVADPFSDDASARLYRTGDLVRYLSDGNIEFLGRIDHQVKIRGIRIELGEIESTLRQHPAVREVVVVTHSDAVGEKRLVAYYLASTADNIPTSDSIDELREFVKRQLPLYMLPTAFIHLDAFPLTPNGKLDRNALPSPETQVSSQSSRHTVAPRTDLEIALVAVWERILGVEGIGIKDSYFDLGGHSLTALKLALEMESVCGIKFDIADIFSTPTIEGLVASLSRKGQEQPSVNVRLNKTVSGAPLICIAGVMHYLDLARALEGAHPVHAMALSREHSLLQYVREGQPQAIPVGQLATSYCAAIRQSNIPGPYHLAGLSVGGIIALEVAARLEEEGHTVSHVFLFDAILPRFIHRTFLRRAVDWIKISLLEPIAKKSEI